MLCLLAPQPLFAATELHVEVEGDSLSIEAHTTAVDELLPQFVQDRLHRGLPATVGLQVDLWRSRSGWFDSHLHTEIREYRISRDVWTERFQLNDSDDPEHAFSADSLSTLVTEIESRSVALPFYRPWARSGSKHWVEVTAVIVPLALSDLGEVDEWISGEVKEGPLLGIPKGLFRIVRDLRGLGDRRYVGRSRPFRISLIANDQVWIQAIAP